jgi:hypothetical protein
MQKIIFPNCGESNEKMDVQMLCNMLTAMQLSSSKRKGASLGDYTRPVLLKGTRFSSS